jgi:hypothetical protein
MNLSIDTLTVRPHHLMDEPPQKNSSELMATKKNLQYIDVNNAYFTLSFANMLGPRVADMYMNFFLVDQDGPTRHQRSRTDWSELFGYSEDKDYSFILIGLVSYSVNLRGAQIVIHCAASMVENLDCIQHSEMAREVDKTLKASTLMTEDCSYARCWETIRVGPCKGEGLLSAQKSKYQFSPQSKKPKMT